MTAPANHTQQRQQEPAPGASSKACEQMGDALMVCEEHGVYVPASIDHILGAARHAIDERYQRGCAFVSPQRVTEFLIGKMATHEREVFAVMFMDTRHRLIAFEELFQGSIDSATVHVREIVKAALKHNAAAVILSHNHPSGNPEPSGADRAITKTIKQASGLVDVRILDHVIVGGNEAVSFVQRGIL